MKRYFNIIAFQICMIYCFTSILLINGCKKFVDVAPPVNLVVTSQVFNNASTANSAQLTIYAQMFNNEESFLISSENGLLADELTPFSGSQHDIDYYHNSLTTLDNDYGEWTAAYNYIYQANNILAALQNNSAIPQTVVKHLQGESLFIRSFWYFYLVSAFGDVPLATTPNYSVNAALSRTPKAQVYQQMVTDLKTAEGLLSNNYLDATDTAMTTERARPNSSAASALLARIYLYMGSSHYSDAYTEASKVINNSMYQLVTPLTQTNYAFTANSSEAIWQLAQPLPVEYGGATPDGAFYTLYGVPNQYALSTQLVNSFEPGDLRFSVWVGSVTEGGVTYYYPAKYKVNQLNADPNNVTEYTMVLRLAEQYLIRAEAQANGAGNGISGAIADLNVIRNRAGLPSYAGLQDRASVLAAILHERQVELFTEWGHRWFDLIRTGTVNSVMGSPGNECQAKGGTWNNNGQQLLYPIPLSDIIADPNLKQNAGY